MTLIRISKSKIKEVFLDLWKEKGCDLPFSKEEFQYWCDNELPDDVIALGLMNGEDAIVGGVIVMPMFLPQSLFIQLMITLGPEDRREFRQPLMRIAKAMGFDRIMGICPENIAGGMERLFGAQKIGEMLIWDSSGK